MYVAPYYPMTKKEQKEAGEETLRAFITIMKILGFIFILYIIGTIIGLAFFQ